MVLFDNALIRQPSAKVVPVIRMTTQRVATSPIALSVFGVLQYTSARINFAMTGFFGRALMRLQGIERARGISDKLIPYQTTLSGGLPQAIDFASRLAGTRLQFMQPFENAMFRIIVRVSGENGTDPVTVDVINKTMETIEKIRFVQ